MKKIAIIMLFAMAMMGTSAAQVFAGHGGSCSSGDKASCSTDKKTNVKTNFVPGNRA